MGVFILSGVLLRHPKKSRGLDLDFCKMRVSEIKRARPKNEKSPTKTLKKHY